MDHVKSKEIYLIVYTLCEVTLESRNRRTILMVFPKVTDYQNNEY